MVHTTVDNKTKLESKPYILFISQSPNMSDGVKAFEEKFVLLSRIFSGEIICSIVKGHYQEAKNLERIGKFNIHPYKYIPNSILSNLLCPIIIILEALRIFYFKKRKYNVIISKNPIITGLTALLIGKLTHANVLIEVNGNFESAFKFGRKGQVRPDFMELIKNKISKPIIRFTLKRADMVKLLYSKQLDALNIHGIGKTMTFADFVPISYFIEANKTDGKYVLLMGYPWYLKGVDILIKAFNKITDEFPDYRLKIVGWCPEGREYFENLAKDNPKIDLCEPVFYDGVIKFMTGCSIYVLASRTEAMGRVLLEAMASKKPIIASNVGGISSIIKDGFNGLLFEKENVDELAAKMRLLLSDNKLLNTLAENGFLYVQKYLSEQCYINNYRKLLDKTLNRY